MMFRGSRKSQKNDVESHLVQLAEAGYGLSDGSVAKKESSPGDPFSPLSY